MSALLCALLVGATPQLELQATHNLTLTRWGYDPARNRVFGNDQVWDARTGFVQAPQPGVKDVLPSADGTRYLLTRKDGIKELREASTGRVLWTLDDGVKKSLQRIKEISADGRYLLLGAKDLTRVVLYDTQTKKKLKTFRGKKDQMSARFGPSGRAAILSGFGPYISVVELPSMKTRFEFKSKGLAISVDLDDEAGLYCAAFRSSGQLILGDAKTGKVRRTLQPPAQAKYTGCAFTAKPGEFVSVYKGPKARSTLQTHAIKGGVINSYGFEGVSYQGLRSHLARSVLTTSAGGSVLAWHTLNHQPLFQIGKRAPWLASAKFTPDSRQLFVSAKNQLYVLDIESLNVTKALSLIETVGHPGRGVGWTADGRIIVSTQPALLLLDPITQKVDTLLSHTGGWSKAQSAVSADGIYVAVTEHNKKASRLKLLKLPEGRLVDSHALPAVTRALAISKDGAKVAMLTKDAAYVAHRGKKGLHKIDIDMPRRPDDFDFNWPATSLLYGQIVAADAASGPKLTNFGRPAGHRFAPFEGGLAAGIVSAKPRIEIRGSETGAAKKVIPLDFAVRHLEASPDGRWVVAADLVGRIVVANARSGKWVHFAVRGGDWLAYTPQGYFVGSRNAGRLAAFRSRGLAYPLEQFASTRNRPDKVLRHLGVGGEALLQHYGSWHQRRLRRLGIQDGALLAPPRASIISAEPQGPRVQLELQCTKTERPVARYQIYVNDVPTLGATGRAYSGKTKAEVALADGLNKIEVSCQDNAGAESLREVSSHRYSAAEKPDLYFVGFGVSNYKNPSLNLEYAAKDAKDLSAALQKLKRGAFERLHIKTYFDEEVSREVFGQAQAFVQKAQPDDLVVVFIAGHGMHDAEARGGYYFLTHEADPKSLSTSAAPFERIESLLYSTRARQKLFLMDTCESGELGGEAAGRSMATLARGTLSRGLRRKTSKAAPVSATRTLSLGGSIRYRNRYIYNDLLRRSGAVVFSSSSGGELSYESKKLQNGYFTEGILRALHPKRGGDQNRDARLSIDELERFVRAFVRKESRAQQNPSIDRDNIFVDIRLPLR